MSLVQQSQPVPSPEAQWWARVYPHAIKLERRITPDPASVPQEQRSEFASTLQQMEQDLKRIPHSRMAAEAHQSLLRAVRYLHLCYDEHLQGRSEESSFYYHNALVQVTQVHQFLVDAGLTKG